MRKSKDEILNEIESCEKEYISGVDEDEYKSYLQAKFSLELLEIDITSFEIGEPLKEKKR